MYVQKNLPDEQMDLEEWEFLPEDGLIDLHEDHTGKNLIRENYFSSSNHPNNYFPKFIEPQRKNPRISPNLIVPVPVQFDPDEVTIKEVTDSSNQSVLVLQETPEKIEKGSTFRVLDEESEQGTVSQVFFFNKMKENEFVDMKLDSPKSINRGFASQIDLGTPRFDGKSGQFDDESEEIVKKEVVEEKENLNFEEEKANWEEDNNGGLNVWKWAMTGVGALCSFGFAVAAVSVVVLGGRRRENHHRKNQEIHFQLYTDDKRMNEVVHHATKLNEVISAMKGAPLATRAHITIGGYYDAL